MVGIIMVAHLKLSEELLKAARIISNSKLDHFKAISINLDDDPERAIEKILSAVKEVDTGDGVLILVDMFGGTPSNLSLSLLDKGKTEIVTGVNLPMILEAASISQKVSLSELVDVLIAGGQGGIRSAGDILEREVVKNEEI